MATDYRLSSRLNGYRDTVTEDVGIRVPRAYPAGLGGDLIHRYAQGTDNYDYYTGHSSSFVAVDAAPLRHFAP